MQLKEDITKIINGCNSYTRDTGEFGFDNNKAITEIVEYIEHLNKPKEIINTIVSINRTEVSDEDYVPIKVIRNSYYPFEEDRFISFINNIEKNSKKELEKILFIDTKMSPGGYDSISDIVDIHNINLNGLLSYLESHLSLGKYKYVIVTETGVDYQDIIEYSIIFQDLAQKYNVIFVS